VIKSFRCRETEKLFIGGRSRRFQSIERGARRKLEILDAAISLNELAMTPGNELEQLRGGRSGQYSIRINRQWRICFEWRGRDAERVEIVDYH
jgi:proteic killer suppression protein